MTSSPEQPDAPVRVPDCHLSWPGRTQAAALAETFHCPEVHEAPQRSVGPHQPDAHQFIEGDNLDALHHLQRSHAGRVRLILIDPPYNTETDFFYSDRHSAGAGRCARSGWLGMMWPRLMLAHRLLAPDGVLLVHIDEHESASLRLLLDELFGRRNDLGEIIWDKRNPKGDARRVACQHETILVYARDAAALHRARRIRRPKANALRMLEMARRLVSRIGSSALPDDIICVLKKYELVLSEQDQTRLARPYTLDDARRDYREWVLRQNLGAGESAYRHLDDDGQVYRRVSMAWPNKRSPSAAHFEPLRHPLTGAPCPVPARGWRNAPATMARLLAAGQIVFGPDETKQPERKYLLADNAFENISSVLAYGGSDDALLARMGIPFDTPKPLGLVRALILAFGGGEGIVLDFFAGSGTVGHACMELRAAGHPVTALLVQSAAPLDAAHPGQRAGAAFCAALGRPAVISEIALERLRRVRALLAAEPPGAPEAVVPATAFRVLTVSAHETGWSVQQASGGQD